MMTVVIGVILATIVLLGAMAGAIYCCFCVRKPTSFEEEQEGIEERQRLLGSRTRFLQRTSTYYQWNRPAPTHCASSTLPSSDDTWSSRRSALLKKYARKPSIPPAVDSLEE